MTICKMKLFKDFDGVFYPELDGLVVVDFYL